MRMYAVAITYPWKGRWHLGMLAFVWCFFNFALCEFERRCVSSSFSQSFA